jgi:NhaP-type Na+/H+ or K+/H+ antiporter
VAPVAQALLVGAALSVSDPRAVTSLQEGSSGQNPGSCFR